MENQNIKRGIDFENRFGQGLLNSNAQKAFAWWKGGKINKMTFAMLAFVFLLNLYFLFPLFGRDLSHSFSSSMLQGIGNVIDMSGVIHKRQFFSFLAIVSLSLAPISYYLFVRKLVFRHETTALLSTLFYIIPNPLSSNALPFASAMLNGDGAHAVAFSAIPLLLLYMQAFVSTGTSAWSVMSAIGMAIVAIISPFAFFNLLIIGVTLTISDGFLGNLRIKIGRFLFLCVSAVCLTLFWYSPLVIIKISILTHVQFAMKKFWSVMPLFIPLVPVVGFLAFLVFDRREKLKPIFVGISLFAIYFLLYNMSRSLQSTGVFTAERYGIEQAFVGGFSIAILIIAVSEISIRYVLLRIKETHNYFLGIVGASAMLAFLFFLIIASVQTAREAMKAQPIRSDYAIGIGSMARIVRYTDFSTILATLISLATLGFLVYLLIRFPSVVVKKNTKTAI